MNYENLIPAIEKLLSKGGGVYIIVDDPPHRPVGKLIRYCAKKGDRNILLIYPTQPTRVLTGDEWDCVPEAMNNSRDDLESYVKKMIREFTKNNKTPIIFIDKLEEFIRGIKGKDFNNMAEELNVCIIARICQKINPLNPIRLHGVEFTEFGNADTDTIPNVWI